MKKAEGEYISIYFNNLLSDDKLNTYNQIIGIVDDVKRTSKVDNKYFAGKFNQNIPTIIGRKITDTYTLMVSLSAKVKNYH